MFNTITIKISYLHPAHCVGYLTINVSNGHHHRGHLVNLTSTSIDHQHGSRILSTLRNYKDIVSSLESELTVRLDWLPSAPALPNALSSGLLYAPNANEIDTASSSSLGSINRTFSDLFISRRSDEYNSTLKDQTRQSLIGQLASLGLQVLTQGFRVRVRDDELGGRKTLHGVNVIAILPGRHRTGGTGNDSITIFGAHYGELFELFVWECFSRGQRLS